MIEIVKKTSTENTTSSPGRKILYIVEHYTAGVTSKPGAAINTAGWFANPSAQASADFIVDDSTIVQFNPDPKNRYCWSVGGSNYGNKGGRLYGVAKNSNSISIEICSTNPVGKITYPNDPNYSFTDAVLKKALELTKYLMEVYGIDADHVIRHYDVNGKPCPGIIGWNAESGDESKWNAFKAQLGGTTETGTKPVAVSESNNEKTIWDTLKGFGLNDYAVAGIMGNLFAESGLRPNNLQNTYEKSLGMTDAEYTAAVDNGSYTNFIKDSAGYGLAQWTYWSRKQALKEHADWLNVSIADLAMQLDFLIKEISGYTAVMNVLKSATSVRAASDAVLTGYERPADQSESVQVKRAGYGQTYYNKYASDTNANTSFPDCPFTVKVIIDDLNYRSEPSMNGKVNGQTGKGVFTIVEVSNGWGKLKSGVGWIYLENPAYVTVGNAVKTTTPAATFTPYTVRVSINDLNIRSGAGTDNKVVQICPPGVYTIVAEASGKGATLWGKLKSGVGWISLDYATKL